MPINAETRRAIEKKARVFDAAKSRTEERIKSNVRVAIEKLQSAERELLDEVEIEFGENPFSSFLSKEEDHTEEGIRNILCKEIPSNFGPSEESFFSLLKEIESFKTWERKVNPFDLIPQNLKCTDVTWNTITVTWNTLNSDSNPFYEVELRTSGSKSVYHTTQTQYTFTGLKSETDYLIRVCAVSTSGLKSMWCDSVTAQTTNEPFTWKKCPEFVCNDRKYSVDTHNPRITTKIGGDCYCTIVDNVPIPLNKIIYWSIKVLKSRDNDGGGIFIGVGPSDIFQDDDNSEKCGWYLDCGNSTLYSGPPHKYSWKEYGPRKGNGQYMHTGDCVGVAMDTAKGELSFIVYGVNLGVAYEGIPLDKPLVPCVLLLYKGDSVELDTSEVEENVDSSIPVPSNVTAKSGITWDSITLTWDVVEGASFYQIEVDGNIFRGASTTNTFIKRELLPDTEYTFRIRAVRGNSVGKWSDAVKGRTQKESIETSWWKECPVNVYKDKKYSVDNGNPRIATKTGDYNRDHDDWHYYYSCTIIGNTHLPLNKATSWGIKILESSDNNGDGIFIGVAPSNINQNTCNYKKCGWYFDCGNSQLWSGLPHNCNGKEYGPRKGWGNYVHTRGIVGVVMDTTKGVLSFVLIGVNLGVAYKGIPLDKPLVPCVILGKNYDSVEFIN